MPSVCRDGAPFDVQSTFLLTARYLAAALEQENNVGILLLLFAYQHKAAGMNTKQNVKQRLQRLLIRCSLCYYYYYYYYKSTDYSDTQYNSLCSYSVKL